MTRSDGISRRGPGLITRLRAARVPRRRPARAIPPVGEDPGYAGHPFVVATDRV